jgi:DNA polymerase epsilon subunit 1
LWKKVREKDDKYRQRNISDMFGNMQQKVESFPSAVNDFEGKNSKVEDMEDFGSNKENLQRPGARTVVNTYQTNRSNLDCANGQEKKRCPVSDQADHRGSGILTESHHQNGATDKIGQKSKDYGDWLQEKKLKWKELREMRKRQR